MLIYEKRTTEMKFSENFLQNDSNFIKMYLVLVTMWHLEVRLHLPFSEKIQDFNGQYI